MSSTNDESLKSHGDRPVPKKLIVCCDGTWKDSLGAWYNPASFSLKNLFNFSKTPQQPTNITRLTRAIKTRDTRQSKATYNQSQVVFYQAGVGTAGTLVNRLIGGALGAGLAANVREAYAFVATNYEEGDEVFLIGFSRGAYTARAVGGLIGDMGLLTKDAMDHFYDIYSDWNNAGKRGYKSLLAASDHDLKVPAPPAPSTKGEADNIRPYLAAYHEALQKAGYTMPKPVAITAIGVFETVGALGIPVSPFLQRLGLPYALHPYRFYDTALSGSSRILNAFQMLALDEHRSAYAPTVWEKPAGVETNLKQTWLPGAHSGVGGGYPDTGISDISLGWMMSQLEPWIDFDPEYLQKQFELNQKYLDGEIKKKKIPPTALRWAASQLHDTATGIRGLLGKRWRTPGRYHRVDRATDRPIQSEPLRNTNERIHISMRSRERTGGLYGNNKFVRYVPKAMEGYVLQDPGAELGKGWWVYQGEDKRFEGKVLVEDELGVFERGIYLESSETPAVM